jgi:hypothetical protein
MTWVDLVDSTISSVFDVSKSTRLTSTVLVSYININCNYFIKKLIAITRTN